MKRILLLILVGFAVLALAPPASARVIELGKLATPAAKPDCPFPSDCQAVGRVTGYQARSGALRRPFVIRRAGYIVAFTVAVGRPTSRQRSFFTNLYGGPPQVRLSILRKGRRRSNRHDHRLLAQSRPRRVDRYFGSRPTFAFGRPIRVRRGNIVGLTVPTWAPVFAPRLPRSNWWRSSRPRGTCDDVGQHAEQERRREVVKYGCTYFTARLLYTATYIPDPRRTDRRR